jgi:hypothetical protein
MKTNYHLLPQGDKIYVVNVPGKPDAVMFETIYVAKKINKYKRELKQALSNKIEVHKDSVDLAKASIRLYLNLWKSQKSGRIKFLEIKEGELYPIAGLKVEIESHCCNPDCYNECNMCEHTKDFALLSVEQPEIKRAATPGQEISDPS